MPQLDREMPIHPQRAPRSAWLWVAIGTSLVALVSSGIARHAFSERDAADRRTQETADQLAGTTSRVGELTSQLGSVRATLVQSEEDRGRLERELNRSSLVAHEALQKLEEARKDLATDLDADVKQGNVLIRRRGNDLLIDVSEHVLFETGEAELGSHGKQVLLQVAKALGRFPNYQFQVSGHTDSARVVSKEVKEHFPTNWELSTARATAVVRYLQEQCGVAGNRLVAAGYAQFRPKASNATEEGRKQNRRIELAMLKEEQPDAGAPLK